MTMYLRDLTIGERAAVTGFREGASHYRQKLLAMGLTPGTELSVVRVAPLGDPVEIRVRGFSLSLRKAEADALRIERVSP
jgi:ferrous iron transport protein A